MRGLLCGAAAAVCFLGATQARAEDPARRVGSLHKILGLPSPTGVGTEEIADGHWKVFELHLGPMRSTITWRWQRTIFFYEIEGEGHQRHALDLLRVLRVNGLVGFVAERRGGRDGTYDLRRVRALKIRTQPADGA